MSTFIIGTLAGTAVFYGSICLMDKLVPDFVPVWFKDAKDNFLDSLPLLLIINGLTFIVLYGYDRFSMPSVFEIVNR